MTDKVTTLRKSHHNMTVPQMLACAQEVDLGEALVIGYDQEDRLIVLHSGLMARDVLWLLEQAKQWLIDACYEDEE